MTGTLATSAPALSNRRQQKSGPDSGRPVTVKFPEIDHDALHAVAFAAGLRPAQQVRAALDDYFLMKMSDREQLEADITEARNREHKTQEALLAAVAPGADPGALPTPPVQEQDPGAKKALTVRLDASYLNRCAAFGLIYDTSIAEQVREAVDYFLGLHVGDAEARRKLALDHEKSRERLAKTLEATRAQVLVGRPA